MTGVCFVMGYRGLHHTQLTSRAVVGSAINIKTFVCVSCVFSASSYIIRISVCKAFRMIRRQWSVPVSGNHLFTFAAASDWFVLIV